jgi:hypothetical protein
MQSEPIPIVLLAIVSDESLRYFIGVLKSFS